MLGKETKENWFTPQVDPNCLCTFDFKQGGQVHAKPSVIWKRIQNNPVLKEKWMQTMGAEHVLNELEGCISNIQGWQKMVRKKKRVQQVELDFIARVQENILSNLMLSTLQSYGMSEELTVEGCMEKALSEKLVMQIMALVHTETIADLSRKN